MIKNILIFLGSLSVAGCLSSCSSSYHASAWKAADVDLKKYKTFAWVAPGDTTLTMERKDKLFAGTIYLFANEQLKKKGMVLVKTRPDVVFMFDTQIADKMRYDQSATLSVGVGYGGPGYNVGGMAPVAGGKITAVPYKDGRLIIEMFDAREGKLLWRGWAEESLDYKSDVTGILKFAIRDIMYKLPIKHKI